ncbi:unnamed protein product, partial [marine sediment metagenome]
MHKLMVNVEISTVLLDFELTPEALQDLRYQLEVDHGPNFTENQVNDAINEWVEATGEIRHAVLEADWSFDWSLKGATHKTQA